MSTLLAVVLQFFVITQQAAIFHTGSEPQAFYLTNLAPSLGNQQWTIVDLKAIDPRFAQVGAVDLEGILVITQGPLTSLCQVQVQFKDLRSGQTTGNYQWQMLGSGREAVPSVNQPFKSVTLVDGTFLLWWAYEPSCPTIVNAKVVKAYF
jgi:hypothetical protein